MIDNKNTDKARVSVPIQSIEDLDSTIREIEVSLIDFDNQGDTKCLLLKARVILMDIKTEGDSYE